MTDYQRLKRVVFWILSQGLADTQEEIALKIGSNVSYLSQVVNGKKRLTEKYVNNLCDQYEKVNPIWILKGEGVMAINGNDECECCRKKDKEIERLNMILRHYEELLGFKKPESDKKVSSGSSSEKNLAS